LTHLSSKGDYRRSLIRNFPEKSPPRRGARRVGWVPMWLAPYIQNLYKTMHHHNLKKLLLTLCWLSLGQLPLINSAQATPDRQSAQPHLKITVNSDRDNIAADTGLTLREAIALTNGDLKLDQLSPQERAQVREIGNSESRIEFALPTGSTKILLTTELPPIQAGVSIDGSTQPGYVAPSATKTNLLMSRPVVEITPAENVEIARGISILADHVTIQGLSIYGFRVGSVGATQNIPAGDIFIAHRLPAANLPLGDNKLAPKHVRIENNFLGIKPDSPNERLRQRTTPAIGSDFGVYVFASQGTTIRRNVINSHTASGIITAVTADNLLIQSNILIGNGTAGMPDAIRLEGEIRNNKIDTNLICANDGSGIFLFKPAAGAVNIHNNTLKFNGRRFRRAAIHLMGNDNHVSDNYISNQAGAGVSVSAFSTTANSTSARNIITSNRFSFLEGLSVDLNTYRNEAIEDFQDGDGINPVRNSENRRLDTGNMAINAPRFLAPEFLVLNDRVNVDGIADPGTQIELYKVNPDLSGNGPLSRALTTVTADSQGKFGATLTNLQPGEVISAIATDPHYGTSEPARNAIAIAPGSTTTIPQLTEVSRPECPTSIPAIANADPAAPVAITPVPPSAQPSLPPTPPAKIQLKIPANVHFALDRSNITPISGEVIRQIAQVLTQYPNIILDLEGHTDPRADRDYNQRLGMRRAIATRKYLVEQGIDPARITIRSFGETRLKSPRQNSLDYARDRRVEFIYRDIRGIELEIIEQEQDLQLDRQRR
jgi:outer membrane protein OmpA-like peptidoglycan-associated protein